MGFVGCRHKNQLFFTWNGPKEELQKVLQLLDKVDPNVHLKVSMGLKVHYMNILVENRSGQVYSRVDHTKQQQMYTLPYVEHHPIEEHSDWLRFALLRAVCCSTSIMDFQQERIYLELSYLSNGYSLFFVEQRVDHFFNHFHASTMRYSADQKLYDSFRLKVMNFVEQQQLLVEKTRLFDDDRKLFHLHYLYEYGPRSRFHESFYRLWQEHFKRGQPLSLDKSKILLTTKQQYGLNALLVQPKPLYRTLNPKKN